MTAKALASEGPRGRGSRRLGPEWIALLLGAVVFFQVWAPNGWPVLIMEGGLALLLLPAAVGWGVWPARWLTADAGIAAGKVWLLATALGLGVLGFLTLSLGMVGFISATSAWSVVIVGWLLAAIGVQQGVVASTASPARQPSDSFSRLRVARVALMAPLAVPLGVLLLGAVLPPGVLWIDEARGYDSLTYHLQAPREYLLAGRIHFLPHNVYAQFPQQVEILYLLLMALRGEAHVAAHAAHALHGCLGVLAVAAIGAWSASGWPRLIAIVLVGATPWLAYTGALAYVEMGLLLFAAVSVGLLLDALERGSGAGRWRLVAAAGLCAGLAGGCKYTALVMVAVALGAGLLLCWRGALRGRLTALVLFGVAAGAAFAPWALRNMVLAGNPVYPFAYAWFGGEAWSAEQAEQWRRGHQLSAADQQLGRGVVAARELFGVDWSTDASQSSGAGRPLLFNEALLLLGVVGALLVRDRATLLLVVWAVVMVLTWGGLTYMPGRFILPVVVPLGLLAGRGLLWRGPGSGLYDTNAVFESPRWVRMPILVVTALGAVMSAERLWRETARTERVLGGGVAALRTWVDGTQLMREIELANRVGDGGRRVWLVGPASVFYVAPPLHYTVAFNRDPWLAYCATAGSDECVAWLRSRGVTHVLFSWPEIERLSRTYGFANAPSRGWVSELETWGLRLVELDDGWRPSGVEVYEVVGT